MATKVDPAVAKQRKQRMILIFGGVILAGLVAFQGPKLMKQLRGPSTSSSAAPATTTTPTTAPTTAPTTTQAGGVTSPAVSTGGTRGQTAQVAGVVIRPAGAPSAATGQRFVMKLVFTGAQPEQIAGFNQQAGAPSGQTAATSTQTTTTASTP